MKKNAKRTAVAVRLQVALAFALSMCLGACDPGSMTLSPWHMWGDSKVVGPVAAAGAGTGVTTATTQITRISYARPETWRWLWRVDILEGSASAAGGTLAVVCDVTTGVGRASTKIRIGKFVFVWGAGPVPVVPSSFASKWATSVNGPNPDDTVVVVPASTPLQNVIDHFVGQDIQVEVSSQFFGTAGETVKYQVTTLFSPETHIRPEWFREHFPAGEDAGR